MTAKELSVVLKQAIDAGDGDCEVLFDSCAQHFKVHMVKISSAYYMESEYLGKAIVSLNFNFKGQIQKCDL